MSRRHYNLPPLTTLAAFEAAARHLSFKDAAQELSVTPGAVSHQIKALEGELSAALFWRRHRGVELTEEGKALYETLAMSFSRISQTLDVVRNRHSAGTVTIGSSTAVASLWLSASVIRFMRQHPEHDVNQLAQDRLFRNRPDVDLYIRYGGERDPSLSQTPLYRDHLVPVSNAEMAEKLSGESLETLAQQRLVHLESDDSSWTTWSEWFRDLGYEGPISGSIRVNSYAVALQMAQDGVGLVLGWQRLVSPMIETGQLVPIGPHSMMAPHQFHLVGVPDEELAPAAKILKQWIIDELAVT